MPESFADLAPHVIAVDRTGKQASGNNHAKTRKTELIRLAHDLKIMSAHCAPMCKHRFEFRRLQQALAAGKTQSAGQT